jgi:phospholipase C
MAHERGRSGLGRYPRRQFLRRAGAISLTGLAAPLLASPLASPAAADTPTESPIKQIIVCCQENHSFDNYFGSYSGLPAGYRIPADWENSGHKPFHFPNHTGNESNPDHEWDATHAAYDDGKMDGFYSNGNGENALGFYDESDLLYYYSLFQQYTLCANYFCGILGPTYPNRMVLYAGTSGGYTDNSAPLDGSFEWPCIISLLQDHNISFKNYNFDCDSNHSILSMWKVAYGRPELNLTSDQFYTDCKQGNLAQVSFITNDQNYDSVSEHPPANIELGQSLMQGIIEAVQASPQWSSTALLLTWDEGGGFFEHVAPKKLDAWGSGVRVPMIMVSPLAKKGLVDTTYSDHGSVLKFIEHVHGLPTLASINHQFDSGTPNVGQGGGAPFPPRDGNSATSDLMQCFDF